MNQPHSAWRKSSRSQGGGTECVEVAGAAARCLVRDSKDPAGAVLAFSLGEWVDFVEQVKSRVYDL